MPIEVNKMARRIRDPHLGFPSDGAEVLAHGCLIGESSHVN